MLTPLAKPGLSPPAPCGTLPPPLIPLPAPLFSLVYTSRTGHPHHFLYLTRRLGAAIDFRSRRFRYPIAQIRRDDLIEALGLHNPPPNTLR